MHKYNNDDMQGIHGNHTTGERNIAQSDTVLGLPRELAKKELIGAFSEPVQYDGYPEIPNADELWQVFQNIMTTMDSPYVIIAGIKYVGKTTFIRNIAKRMNEHQGKNVQLLEGRTLMRILPEVTSPDNTPEAEAFTEYLRRYRCEDCKGIALYTDDQQVAAELLSTPGVKIPIVVEAHEDFNIRKINIHTDGGYPVLGLFPDPELKDNIELLDGIVNEHKDDYIRKFGWMPSRNVIGVITKATTMDADVSTYSIEDALFVINAMCSEYASTHKTAKKPTVRDAFRFIRDAFGITREQYDAIPETMSSESFDDDTERQQDKQPGESKQGDDSGFAFSSRKDLEQRIKSKVIGQDDAIEQMITPILRRKAGLSDEGKPIASMLFAGPSGVGKTEAAKALAKALFDDDEAFKRIDCGELNDKGSASRLIGTTQGYLGFDQAGELTDFISKHPHSVILFDEIEKAHPAVYDTVLLQLLDAGRITGTISVNDEQGKASSKNETVDATGCVIIMTSNLGSDSVGDIGMTTHGFGISTVDVKKKLKQDVMSAVTARFRAEQINRFDQIIIFNALDEKSLEKVFALKWNPYHERLQKKGIHVEIGDSVPAWFAAKSRKDKFGARNLMRTMNNNLINKLADGIVDGTLKKHISVEINDGDIIMK